MKCLWLYLSKTGAHFWKKIWFLKYIYFWLFTKSWGGKIAIQSRQCSIPQQEKLLICHALTVGGSLWRKRSDFARYLSNQQPHLRMVPLLLFTSILQIVYLDSNPILKLVLNHIGVLAYCGTRFISQRISFQLSCNMLLIYRSFELSGFCICSSTVAL